MKKIKEALLWINRNVLAPRTPYFRYHKLFDLDLMINLAVRSKALELSNPLTLAS